jgi:glyoxylase-like metal-dependent hydrolase (beta-lactamase superfamily II)
MLIIHPDEDNNIWVKPKEERWVALIMEDKFIPVTSVRSGIMQKVTPDILCLPIQIVNVCFVGTPGQSDNWVLVDAGMPKSAEKIIEEAKNIYGEDRSPKAIILTHGHFDHVGAVEELVKLWNVPVYAHELEMPYLTGKSDYPPADPSVDSGLVAKMSPMFPREAINLEGHVQTLPADGSVPAMPDWRWIHTPGHTPGHISLFRESDRALLAGDAFTTVKQESLFEVIMQKPELHGPPAYFTTDWQAAWDSVKKLAKLRPSVAVTGHGQPMHGEQLADGLEELARNFGRTEIPEHSRYVD